MLQVLKDWVRWLAGWFVVGIVVVWIVGLLPFGRDSTDGAWPHRSGVSVVTDAQTGCQYLLAPGGAITPRMDGHDKQLGCKQ